MGTVPGPGSLAAPVVPGHSDTRPGGWASGHCSWWAGRGRCCSSGTATFTKQIIQKYKNNAC